MSNQVGPHERMWELTVSSCNSALFSALAVIAELVKYLPLGLTISPHLSFWPDCLYFSSGAYVFYPVCVIVFLIILK